MHKLIIALLASAILSGSLMAYDQNKAAMFEGFYKNFTQQACANTKMFLLAEDAMALIRKEDKNVLFLDIRSSGETSVIGVTIPNAPKIPLAELFKKENLDKLPMDKTIVIVCYSGTRAVMAATGLKMSGIKNVQVLKGGIVALSAANNVKNAPIK
ncbi:MAG: rhodanese-like domain-containing protein [Campylobacterota bacterium]|nr:rhodanese-like domain-containing protein [Campylobacterota bacterium]